MKHFFSAGLLVWLTAIGLNATAQSRPAGISRKTLLEQALPAVTVEDIRIDEITLAPGQGAPVHYHPCEVYGYVVTGQILYQAAGQPPVMLHAGDSFREAAGRQITVFKNALDSLPSKFIAVYLAKKEQQVTVISTNTNTR
jgi:quercetin dioxygenase-like cupin family protein